MNKKIIGLTLCASLFVLSLAVEVQQIQVNVSDFLREIAEWWHANAWPPLNSLALNHRTHSPAAATITRPGKGWKC